MIIDQPMALFMPGVKAAVRPDSNLVPIVRCKYLCTAMSIRFECVSVNIRYCVEL